MEIVFIFKKLIKKSCVLLSCQTLMVFGNIGWFTDFIIYALIRTKFDSESLVFGQIHSSKVHQLNIMQFKNLAIEFHSLRQFFFISFSDFNFQFINMNKCRQWVFFAFLNSFNQMIKVCILFLPHEKEYSEVLLIKLRVPLEHVLARVYKEINLSEWMRQS